jgi:hypothetical protein
VIVVDEASMLGNDTQVEFPQNAFLAFGSGQTLTDLLQYAGFWPYSNRKSKSFLSVTPRNCHRLVKAFLLLFLHRC